MAERKIFAGPKVRRIRLGLELTQAAMAEGLEISPSYLNLIERNQRPLTVQLLLRLASTYKIDLETLQNDDGALVGELRDVFRDPLLSGELPGDQELVEVADAAPNTAGGILKLYRAYREQAARLSDLAELLAREGHEAGMAAARLPADEVRDRLEHRPYFFARIEDAAEVFVEELAPGDDLSGALRDWLKSRHGIVVRSLPVHVMPDLKRRYDRHSLRLFLSMAQRARYDFDVLRSRFDVSFEQVVNRITTLARPGASGLPFFLFEIDSAGNRLRRAGALGYPHAKFGGLCPRLGVNATFGQPGQILVDRVEMPDGAAYLTVCRTLDGPQVGFNERVRRTAILVGCDFETARDTVYGEAANLPGANVLAGTACRLCERRGCLSRAEPPVTKPLGLDEMASGLSAFDFR